MSDLTKIQTLDSYYSIAVFVLNRCK